MFYSKTTKRTIYVTGIVGNCTHVLDYGAQVGHMMMDLIRGSEGGPTGDFRGAGPIGSG